MSFLFVVNISGLTLWAQEFLYIMMQFKNLVGVTKGINFYPDDNMDFFGGLHLSLCSSPYP